MLVILCRAVICPVFICVVGTRVIAKTDKIDEWLDREWVIGTVIFGAIFVELLV
jgi:hypothetical protein